MEKKYRIVKKEYYHDGVWYYIEYYRKHLISYFDRWDRLQELAAVDLCWSLGSVENDDVRFRTKKECNKYISLL